MDQHAVDQQLPEDRRREREQAERQGGDGDVAKLAMLAHHLVQQPAHVERLRARLGGDAVALDQQDAAIGGGGQPGELDDQRRGLADGGIVKRRHRRIGSAGHLEQQHGIAVGESDDRRRHAGQPGELAPIERQLVEAQPVVVGDAPELVAAGLLRPEPVFSREARGGQMDAMIAGGPDEALQPRRNHRIGSIAGTHLEGRGHDPVLSCGLLIAS